MENWKEKLVEAGRIVEGSKHLITFQGLEGMKEITYLRSSCGCTQPKFDKTTRKLSVTYSANKVSKHLRTDTKQMVASQTITVTYKDATKEILRFNVIVFNN